MVQDISRVEYDAAHSLRRKEAQHQGNQGGQWLVTMIPMGGWYLMVHGPCEPWMSQLTNGDGVRY